MKESMEERVSYEMALLIKENRELRESIENLNGHIEVLQAKYDKLYELTKKKKEHKTHKEYDCDTDVKAGDKIVILDACAKTPALPIGGVFVVKKALQGESAFCLQLHKSIIGAGGYEDGWSRIYSHQYQWKKVSDNTKVTEIFAVAGYKANAVNNYGWFNGVCGDYHHEYENIMDVKKANKNEKNI